MWRVWFDTSTCLLIESATEHGARFEAQLMAWMVTGKWHQPTKVEKYRNNEGGVK